ncbi:hypothetical protein [Nocardia testacea]|uniref:hypothetical protein n=1 Tax=Nocardia testacea TaxID=248551 RepID=UPI003A839608
MQDLEVAFKALVLFKFSEDCEADVFVGSPVMAEAVKTMLNAIEAHWSSVGREDKAREWRELYSAPSLERRVDRVNLVAEYVERSRKWELLTREERLQWLRVAIAPYELDDEALDSTFHHLLILK